MPAVTVPTGMPWIKCWQFSAYPLALMMPEERTRGWMFSHYIQLCAHENFLQAFVPFKFYEFDYALNPWLQVLRLDRDTFSSLRGNIVEFTVDSLRRGYAVYLNLDEYYVPDRIPYGKFNRSHDVLVTGYEEESQTFTLLGYNERLVFSESAVSAEAFAAAYASLGEIANPCEQLYLYKLKEDGSYPLQRDLVEEGLRDYLLSRNTARKFTVLGPPEPDLVFGLETYDIVERYMEHLLGHPDGYVDIRYMHLFLEHKLMMRLRVGYLREHGHLEDRRDLYSMFSAIEKQAESARNLLIKFYRSRRPENVHAVIGILRDVRRQEEPLYHELLEALILSVPEHAQLT